MQQSEHHITKRANQKYCVIIPPPRALLATTAPCFTNKEGSSEAFIRSSPDIAGRRASRSASVAACAAGARACGCRRASADASRNNFRRRHYEAAARGRCRDGIKVSQSLLRGRLLPEKWLLDGADQLCERGAHGRRQVRRSESLCHGPPGSRALQRTSRTLHASCRAHTVLGPAAAYQPGRARGPPRGDRPLILRGASPVTATPPMAPSDVLLPPPRPPSPPHQV
jgi:hypothetical protein